MNEATALATRNADVSADVQAFELVQRQAKALMTADLIPERYRKNLGNVLIALNMAKRLGADPLMVMQNLYVVHGNPGWSAVFLIATFNQNGKFSAIKYRFDGDGDEYGCTAYATELATGQEVEGSKVTWAVVKGEGWSSKQGSKWKTMADQMFRYRAATFFIRSTAPEIAMGLQTKEELDDIGPGPDVQAPQSTSAGMDGLKARMGVPPEALAEAQTETIDYTTGEVIETEPDVTVADARIEPDAVAKPESEVSENVSTPNTRPADTDEEVERAAIEAESDPLETLRANVTAKLDELTKLQRKEILVGKPFVSEMSSDELNQILIDARKIA